MAGSGKPKCFIFSQSYRHFGLFCATNRIGTKSSNLQFITKNNYLFLNELDVRYSYFVFLARWTVGWRDTEIRHVLQLVNNCTSQRLYGDRKMMRSFDGFTVSARELYSAPPVVKSD